jgi:hypothetical protein
VGDRSEDEGGKGHQKMQLHSSMKEYTKKRNTYHHHHHLMIVASLPVVIKSERV